MDVIGTRTVRDLVDEQAQRYGDKTYLVYEAASGDIEEYSFQTTRSRIRDAAQALTQIGIRKSDRVILLMPNCPEFVFAWLGLAYIGAIAVPTNVASTGPELDHVIELSGARGLLYSAKYQDAVSRAALSHSNIEFTVASRGDDSVAGTMAEWWSGDRGGSDISLPADVVSADTAQLVFTSGTTSRPKAVMLTHANYLRSGIREAWASAVDERDILLTALPLFHVNAQSNTVLAAMTVGATCVLIEEYRATKFWRQVIEHRATHLSLVAMQLRTLLAQPERVDDNSSHVRRNMYAINVSDEEKERFESRFGIELVNGYGLSEAMTVVTSAPVHGPKRWPSIGVPALDRRVRVVDSSGTDVAPGVHGEIIIGGEVGRDLMAGYYNDADATAEALRDGWLYTGDTGYFDDHGYLYFSGRSKDMIKRAGENVSASEVESVLVLHSRVDESAVIGVPDPIRDEAVYAYVVLTAGEPVPASELILFCSQRLSKFKVPSTVEIVDSLPKTSVGKVQKKLLREAFGRS